MGWVLVSAPSWKHREGKKRENGRVGKKKHQTIQSDLQTERDTWPNNSGHELEQLLGVITRVTRIYVTCNSS